MSCVKLDEFRLRKVIPDYIPETELIVQIDDVVQSTTSWSTKKNGGHHVWSHALIINDLEDVTKVKFVVALLTQKQEKSQLIGKGTLNPSQIWRKIADNDCELAAKMDMFARYKNKKTLMGTLTFNVTVVRMTLNDISPRRRSMSAEMVKMVDSLDVVPMRRDTGSGPLYKMNSSSKDLSRMGETDVANTETGNEGDGEAIENEIRKVEKTSDNASSDQSVSSRSVGSVASSQSSYIPSYHRASPISALKNVLSAHEKVSSESREPPQLVANSHLPRGPSFEEKRNPFLDLESRRSSMSSRESMRSWRNGRESPLLHSGRSSRNVPTNAPISARSGIAEPSIGHPMGDDGESVRDGSKEDLYITSISPAEAIHTVQREERKGQFLSIDETVQEENISVVGKIVRESSKSCSPPVISPKAMRSPARSSEDLAEVTAVPVGTSKQSIAGASEMRSHITTLPATSMRALREASIQSEDSHRTMFTLFNEVDSVAVSDRDDESLSISGNSNFASVNSAMHSVASMSRLSSTGSWGASRGSSPRPVFKTVNSHAAVLAAESSRYNHQRSPTVLQRGGMDLPEPELSPSAHALLFSEDSPRSSVDHIDGDGKHETEAQDTLVQREVSRGFSMESVASVPGPQTSGDMEKTNSDTERESKQGYSDNDHVSTTPSEMRRVEAIAMLETESVSSASSVHGQYQSKDNGQIVSELLENSERSEVEEEQGSQGTSMETSQREYQYTKNSTSRNRHNIPSSVENLASDGAESASMRKYDPSKVGVGMPLAAQIPRAGSEILRRRSRGSFGSSSDSVGNATAEMQSSDNTHNRSAAMDRRSSTYEASEIRENDVGAGTDSEYLYLTMEESSNIREIQSTRVYGLPAADSPNAHGVTDPRTKAVSSVAELDDLSLPRRERLMLGIDDPLIAHVQDHYTSSPDASLREPDGCSPMNEVQSVSSMLSESACVAPMSGPSSPISPYRGPLSPSSRFPSQRGSASSLYFANQESAISNNVSVGSLLSESASVIPVDSNGALRSLIPIHRIAEENSSEGYSSDMSRVETSVPMNTTCNSGRSTTSADLPTLQSMYATQNSMLEGAGTSDTTPARVQVQPRLKSHETQSSPNKPSVTSMLMSNAIEMQSSSQEISGIASVGGAKLNSDAQMKVPLIEGSDKKASRTSQTLYDEDTGEGVSDLTSALDSALKLLHTVAAQNDHLAEKVSRVDARLCRQEELILNQQIDLKRIPESIRNDPPPPVSNSDNGLECTSIPISQSHGTRGSKEPSREPSFQMKDILSREASMRSRRSSFQNGQNLSDGAVADSNNTEDMVNISEMRGGEDFSATGGDDVSEPIQITDTKHSGEAHLLCEGKKSDDWMEDVEEMRAMLSQRPYPSPKASQSLKMRRPASPTYCKRLTLSSTGSYRKAAPDSQSDEDVGTGSKTASSFTSKTGRAYTPPARTPLRFRRQLSGQGDSSRNTTPSSTASNRYTDTMKKKVTKKQWASLVKNAFEGIPAPEGIEDPLQRLEATLEDDVDDENEKNRVAVAGTEGGMPGESHPLRRRSRVSSSGSLAYSAATGTDSWANDDEDEEEDEDDDDGDDDMENDYVIGEDFGNSATKSEIFRLGKQHALSPRDARFFRKMEASLGLAQSSEDAVNSVQRERLAANPSLAERILRDPTDIMKEIVPCEVPDERAPRLRSNTAKISMKQSRASGKSQDLTGLMDKDAAVDGNLFPYELTRREYEYRILNIIGNGVGEKLAYMQSSHVFDTELTRKATKQTAQRPGSPRSQLGISGERVPPLSLSRADSCMHMLSLSRKGSQQSLGPASPRLHRHNTLSPRLSRTNSSQKMPRRIPSVYGQGLTQTLTLVRPESKLAVDMNTVNDSQGSRSGTRSPMGDRSLRLSPLKIEPFVPESDDSPTLEPTSATEWDTITILTKVLGADDPRDLIHCKQHVRSAVSRYLCLDAAKSTALFESCESLLAYFKTRFLSTGPASEVNEFDESEYTMDAEILGVFVNATVILSCFCDSAQMFGGVSIGVAANKNALMKIERLCTQMTKHFDMKKTRLLKEGKISRSVYPSSASASIDPKCADATAGKDESNSFEEVFERSHILFPGIYEADSFHPPDASEASSESKGGPESLIKPASKHFGLQQLLSARPERLTAHVREAIHDVLLECDAVLHPDEILPSVVSLRLDLISKLFDAFAQDCRLKKEMSEGHRLQGLADVVKKTLGIDGFRKASSPTWNQVEPEMSLLTHSVLENSPAGRGSAVFAGSTRVALMRSLAQRVQGSSQLLSDLRTKLTTARAENPILGVDAATSDSIYMNEISEVEDLMNELSQRVADLVPIINQPHPFSAQDMERRLAVHHGTYFLTGQYIFTTPCSSDGLSIGSLLIQLRSHKLYYAIRQLWPGVRLDRQVCKASLALRSSEVSSQPGNRYETPTRKRHSKPRTKTPQTGTVPSSSVPTLSSAVLLETPELTMESLNEASRSNLGTSIEHIAKMKSKSGFIGESLMNSFSLDFSDVSSLRLAGFTLVQVRTSGMFPESALLEAGFSAKELRSAGMPVSTLREYGYTVNECHAAGIDPSELIAGGYEESEIVKSHVYSLHQLQEAGCDVERFALMSFYDALNGRYWRRQTNWGSALPVCQWYGVYSEDGTGRVTRVDLRANRLEGKIPDNIALLSRLAVLDVSGNENVCGTLPDSMSSMALLRDLWLGETQISVSQQQRAILDAVSPKLKIRTAVLHFGL